MSMLGYQGSDSTPVSWAQMLLRTDLAKPASVLNPHGGGRLFLSAAVVRNRMMAAQAKRGTKPRKLDAGDIEMALEYLVLRGMVETLRPDHEVATMTPQAYRWSRFANAATMTACADRLGPRDVHAGVCEWCGGPLPESSQRIRFCQPSHSSAARGAVRYATSRVVRP